MQRVFKLAFAAVPATSARNFLWVLEPLTPQAYSRARGGLQRNWRDGLMSSSDRRELFTFRDARSTLENILAEVEKIYEQHLRTPEAQSDAGKLWKKSSHWWPVANAEKVAQLYLKVGLSRAFPNCTVRE